jgi:hypothetical protein
MSQQLLFDSDGVSITSSIARFSDASYQIANIGSVRVVRLRTRRAVTVIIFLFGFLLLVAGLISGQLELNSTWAASSGGEMALSGLGIIMGAGLLQLVWPGRKYVLVLKTSGGDTQAFTSRKKDLVVRIQQAIEQAFIVAHQARV